MDYHKLISLFLLGTVAAGAFAVLFNVPVRVLLVTALSGGIALVVRALVAGNSPSLAFGTFLGALSVGVWAAYWSYRVDTPGHVISIPGMIPLIPGVFAYKTLMGIWQFVYLEPQDRVPKLAETVHSGLQTALILLGISLGIAIPNVIHRFIAEKGKNRPQARS